MPANLPPEALAAWERYLEAKTTQEKIRCLQEYISLIPHHKGVEKELRSAKIRLAKLKEELAKERARAKGTGERWLVPKEHDAQVTIIGMPNSGKSNLLNALVDAEASKVADYPFTTTKPEVGVMDLDGALIQIVDLPAIIEGSSEGLNNGTRVLTAIRNSDGSVLVVDLADDPITQLKIVFNELKKANIRLNMRTPPVKIQKTGAGGIQILDAHYFTEEKNLIKEILNDRGIINAVVTFYGPVNLEEFLDAVNEQSVSRKPCVLVANKGDVQGSLAKFNQLNEFVKANNYPFQKVIGVSATSRKGIETLKMEIFRSLDIIRVYTRDSRNEVAQRPLVLKKGAHTVKDAVEMVSKKFLKTFRFARVWGTSVKFDGERVGLDHELADRDQIRIYA